MMSYREIYRFNIETNISAVKINIERFLLFQTILQSLHNSWFTSAGHTNTYTHTHVYSYLNEDIS